MEAFLRRVDTVVRRLAGEEVLVSVLPPEPATLLDLGCGDGRMAALVLDARPSIERVVAVDHSPPMLERAHRRFDADPRVTVGPVGTDSFDVIVSGLAVHHLEDERKQRLSAEVAALLAPGGLFANLDVVASATPELHAEFLALIGRPADDPEDRLSDIGSQLDWLRNAGLVQVDCLWRWRGFALLVGRAP